MRTYFKGLALTAALLPLLGTGAGADEKAAKSVAFRTLADSPSRYITTAALGGLNTSGLVITNRQTFDILDINGADMADGDTVQIRWAPPGAKPTYWHESTANIDRIGGKPNDACNFKVLRQDKNTRTTPVAVLIQTASGKYVAVTGKGAGLTITDSQENAVALEMMEVAPADLAKAEAGRAETGKAEGDKPTAAKPTTNAPATALPATALPATALPATALPATALPATLKAATPVPGATIPAAAPPAAAQRPVDNAAIGDHKPTLFLIGDSTVNNGTPGLKGWGSVIGDYFDKSKINVVNRARGGRSSRTFLTEGLWASVLAEMKAGDYVLMQFGHNDGGRPEGVYPNGRASLRGNTDDSREVETKPGEKEVVHSYGWYLRRYIEDAKTKGATPIVLSMIPRNDWKDGKVVRATDSYGGWAKEAAQQDGVTFVDLNGIVAERYDALGAAAVKPFFPQEHTHTSEAGARLNAQCVVSGLKMLPGDPFSTYLTPAAR